MRVKGFLLNIIPVAVAIFVASLISYNASSLSIKTFGTVSFPSGREDEFAENNIIFYNPEAKNKNNGCGGGGDCDIRGDTLEEKLWSGLTGLEFTPEQTAAIIGNILNEGGTPVRQEGCYISARNRGVMTQEGNPYTVHTYSNEHHSSGMQSICSFYSAGEKITGIGLGFVQWSAQDRREGYLSLMDDAGFSDYFEGDAYKTWGSISSDSDFMSKVEEETGSTDDYYSLWCVALNYIKKEMTENSTYKPFYSKTTVADMASFFAAVYEVCDGCKAGQDENRERQEKAEEIYQKYKNGEFDNITSSGGGSSSGSTSSEDGSNVTIIGDSIVNAAKSEIEKIYPKAEFMSVQDGKKFSGNDSSNPSGLSVLQDASKVRRTLVFALGSNGGATEDAASAVIKRAKEIGANKIIFVTNYSLGAKDYTANNALFNSKKGDDVIIADWAAAVASNPTEYVREDPDGVDVHPTIPKGAELYAKTLQTAITQAGKTSNCAGGDVAAFQETVKKFAWPEHHDSPYTEQMPDYKEATKRAAYKGGCGGNDCGGFVTILMRESGWDPDYNSSLCGTGCQQDYLDSSEKWEDITDTLQSEDDLEPGDVLIVNDSNHGHTLVFVGDIDGFGSKYASASFPGCVKNAAGDCVQQKCGWSGVPERSPMADSGSFQYYRTTADGHYRFYRKTQ